MTRVSGQFGRISLSCDLRILSVMIAGIAIFGVVDGSFWKALLTPTLGYRPAILFALTLVFGWRGFAWSQFLLLIVFAFFLGWRGAILVTPLYFVSQALGLVVARQLARKEPWLSKERSTVAFLAGAALAPAMPALLGSAVLPLVGIRIGPGLPRAVDSWFRGVAPILALAPAVLVYCSAPLKRWVALPSDTERRQPDPTPRVLEIAIELALWTAALWMSEHFKARYGLNVSYICLLPPLAFTLFRGMAFAALMLTANALVATTLWQLLHWANVLAAPDLRLLIAIYSVTVLVLAAVVDERQRGKGQIEKLLTSRAALRESEKHFRMLADSAPVMIWQTGPGGLCRFVNKPWLEFAGMSMEQYQGTGWLNALHPEEVDRCVAAFRSTLEARRELRMECRFRRADGEYRWFLDHGVPLYRDGQFDGFIGSCIDITDLKLTTERLQESEEAARENEQRLASIYNTVRDVIFHLAVEPDGQFRFLSVNKAFLETTGLSREMVIGKTVDEVVPEPSLTVVLRKYRQAVEERTVVVWEETSSYPTGLLTGEVSIAPVFDNQGRCTHLVGSVHDITELVNTQQLLRESEQRLKSAQELAHVGSWHWDLESDRVFCSEECLQIFGQSCDYRPSLDVLLQTIAPRDRGRVSRELKASLALKDGCFTEFQIIRPTGESRTVTFASRVSLNSEGLPRHVFGACQDVTDVRRAQRETFARQKLETLGTLANGIAHDFNNLLGGIVAQVDLALAEVDSAPSLKEQLKSVQDVAMRGSEIVRELMIYAGTETQTLVELNVSRVIEQMMELLNLSVSKHANIVIELASDLPPIRANSARISQLVMNLVTNASEAIGNRPGVIRVITRRTASGGDRVQLEISDTGCGMSPEMRARVFEPFFTTKSTGRGLGLAVVEGIVRSLGGQIQLESEPGKGTTITVSLPCAEADFNSLQGTISDTVEPAPESRVTTVLLVEDEHPLRQAVSKWLSNVGISVIEAADGSLALDAIRDKNRLIDVLILDITIPKVSSRDVFAEAKSLRPEMRAFVTSAYPQEVAATSLQSPIQHFIRKPYRLAQLLELIRQNFA